MSSFESSKNPGAFATLAAYISGGRLPHAILVEGSSGTGEFARAIAKAALCSSVADKPCGVCRDCQKAEKGVHPDLLIYSGGERSRSFHVESVREIKREAYIRPNEANGKVFILENAQNMTIQAQNALLKIIEEPPSAVTFILTCDNKAAMLETVRSRVAVFSLEGTGDENENGLSQKAGEILSLLLSGDELAAMAAFSAYEKDRAGFSALLSELRAKAAAMLIESAAEDCKNGRRLLLIKIIDIIDDMDTALSQNVSGLLLTAMLPARLKAF